MAKLTIEVEIQAQNTPQKWTCSPGTSGIEKLAMLVIAKNLIENEINKTLNSGK